MITDRVEKLAADIREDYPASTVMFLVVLKGGNEFASDLTRAVRAQHACGTSRHLPFTVDFVRVKSYEGTESTGKGAYTRASVDELKRATCRISSTALLSLRQLPSLESILQSSAEGML